MVTAYYIMQLSNKQKIADFNKFYSDLIDPNLKISHENETKCRICLKEGVFRIYDVQDSQDIIDVIQLFGIEITNDDKFPKNLCTMCYKFVKSAILFRKIAKQSNEALKNPIKEELFESVANISDNQDYIDNIKQPKLSKTEGAKDFKTPAKEIKKLKPKIMPKVQCYICNKIVNKSYYKEHLTMHDPSNHKYVCDICGKSFRLRCAYHNHSLRHGTGFPFKCQLCPYKGRYAELLKTHMRTHTGDYCYMCTECPARFLFRSNLNSHVLKKHREREHKCESCKRAFHTKLALERHFEVDHLGIKTHVCNICGNAFGYRNAMMSHQRRVHKRDKMMPYRKPSYLQEGLLQENDPN